MANKVFNFVCTILTAALTFAGAVHAEEQASSMGVHGMVMFGGKEGLYASHMPMYHRPHDVQAIFRFHLSDPALDRKMRDELARRPQLWTIVPERFELDRLASGAANPVSHLHADLVRGHFERGGVTVHSGVDIAVERVLVYRRLDPGSSKDGSMTYSVVDTDNKAKEHFLVKRIEGRPDFDHIVPFAMEGRSAAPGVLAVVRIGHIEAKAAQAELARAGQSRGMQIRPAVYFESDDLQ